MLKLFVASRRFLSCGTPLRSHIGSAPISLVPGTAFDVSPLSEPKIIRKRNKTLTLNRSVTVKGPLGALSLDIPDFVSISQTESTQELKIEVQDAKDKIQKSMWGTVRSLLQNSVTGVNEGHMALLKFVGTGYRVQLEKDGRYVGVKVGASIPQGLDVPEALTVKAPTSTSLIIEGCDKQQVCLFAAQIRKFHPPEPYKGKGIYVNNETIKLKAKKIK